MGINFYIGTLRVHIDRFGHDKHILCLSRLSPYSIFAPMLRSRYEAFDFVEKKAEVKKKSGNPILMIVSGYLALVSLGALLLSLPFAQREPVGVIDAFFTAMSAVCVTGLSTIDISASFTTFGNWVLVPPVGPPRQLHARR